MIRNFLEHSLKPLRTQAVLATIALTFVAWTAKPLSAEPQHKSVRVAGLPAGLNVSLTASAPCSIVPALGIHTESPANDPPAARISLTEETYTAFEQATLPGGMVQLRSVTHTDYVGEIDVPAHPFCFSSGQATIAGSIPPNNLYGFHYRILGEENGVPKFREIKEYSNGVPFQGIGKTFEAKTGAISLQPLTTMSKGNFHSVWVEYLDTFGGSSVVTSSLDLYQQFYVNGAPFNLSRVKMWLTPEDRICVRAAGVTQCAASGLLTNGNITVDVSRTLEPTYALSLLLNGKRIAWTFKFESGFPAENFTVVAAADDSDLDAYNVNGQGQALDLLPWKSVRIPVRVVE